MKVFDLSGLILAHSFLWGAACATRDSERPFYAPESPWIYAPANSRRITSYLWERINASGPL